MKKSLLVAAVGLIGVGAYALTPTPAEACGGFFCGQTPVDQSAERIIFAVDEVNNETKMIVQIGYSGDSEDFSWIVPLQNVPKEGSFDTFPQFAMNALDANTSPRIQLRTNCQNDRFFAEDASNAPQASGADPTDKDNVIVHQKEQVGPYDVVVVESDSADDLVQWLRANGYRVTSPMLPYIENYVTSEMKFLALKLQPGAKVSQIAPFQMTLPGTSPGVPLKMTALAAEPEMGVLVTVLGPQRYQGANWPNLEVPDDYIHFSNPWGGQNNWPAAVARTVDEAGGNGWVTEFAKPTTDLVELLGRTMPNDEDQAEATMALLELLRPNRYMTRMYSRLSPEEMTSDPVFRKSASGDVERFREVVRDDYSDSECEDLFENQNQDPCNLVTCGAGGTCRSVENDDGRMVAGCACVPGATARTSMGPDGNPAVYCQDQRLSFLNPGDVEVPGEAPIPDACAGFDCGAGSCIAMNMTPTCVCDLGLVAFGGVTEAGGRLTTCAAPTTAVPRSFYDLKLPTRPLDLPEGREDVLMPREIPQTGCSAGPAPTSGLAGFLGVVGLAGLVARRRRR